MQAGSQVGSYIEGGDIMNQSKLTVDEVMLRIKEAMRAENMKINQDKTDNNSMPAVNQSTIQNKLHDLDLELRNNNLRWNIMTEWLITSHRKTVGSLIVFGKKTVRKFLRWYINPPIDQQREFNGSVTRSLNVTGDLLHSYAKEIEQNRVNVLELIEQVKVLQKENMELVEQFKVIQAENMRLQSEFESIQIQNRVKENNISDIEANISGLFAELTIANDRLRRIERKVNEGLSLDIQTPTIDRIIADDKMNNLDFDYFLFEQRFRGSREEIKKRQGVYVEYFSGKSNVLDFGCGRGEFVELMIENGVNVTGVDLNTDMVAYCQDRGLPVIEADGLEYLRLQNDNSLGGLFAAQVIEHLTTAEMIQMIRIAFNKLSPGGCLLLETINLQTLLIFANQFYMDPSHNKPVHPETVKFILQSEGFKDIKFIYSSPVKDRFVPFLQIEGTESNVQEFNAGVNNINNLLFGNQDYAVIAYK